MKLNKRRDKYTFKVKPEEEKMNNSDILFIYDAKLCNPNGDPDDENKPRMDYDTRRNLVSDVRLKRYIRDYLLTQGYDIFVYEAENKKLTATESIVELFKKNGKEIPGEEKKPKLKREEVDWILSKLIDVRLFGAVIPDTTIEMGEKTVKNAVFTGPVQFNWGYSLNRVTIVESSSITSHFRTGEEKGAGAIGKDWKVYYSLIAFHGIVSGKRAQKTRLSEADIRVLDNALLKAIPLQATTRSKIGQTPRLLLRIEYKDDTTFLGDLRRYVEIKTNEEVREENLRDISDLKLKVKPLVDILEKNKDKIEKIYLWQHEDLAIQEEKSLKELCKERNLEDKVVDLPHSE